MHKMRLGPPQIWVPDIKSTPFKREAHRKPCLITTDPAEERRLGRHGKGARLPWKVRLHVDGARVIEPGRVMGKGARIGGARPT